MKLRTLWNIVLIGWVFVLAFGVVSAICVVTSAIRLLNE